ncbi:MaoC family dehydratase [Rhodococcus sp. HNM0569]|uniref:FAS1-like dehydratase domain-containing protein n=1 Tax=Rhodococcus sp. HNM0569 TaxID=2716340 RepID=UPI00146E1BBE|nr:MaoC family dehydratase [Rhodococcus sp. HNM0569]
MTATVPDLEGKTFGTSEPYVVERAKIIEFATAIHAAHPYHYDADAARAAGYRDVIAPPTFTAVVQAGIIEQMFAEMGITPDPTSLVAVHTSETMTVTEPVTAGDRLTARLVVAEITRRGPAAFLTLRCHIVGADGNERVEVVSTVVVGPPPEE